MLRPSQPIRKVLSATWKLIKLQREILETSVWISGVPQNETSDTIFSMILFKHKHLIASLFIFGYLAGYPVYLYMGFLQLGMERGGIGNMLNYFYIPINFLLDYIFDLSPDSLG